MNQDKEYLVTFTAPKKDEKTAFTFVFPLNRGWLCFWHHVRLNYFLYFDWSIFI